MDANEKGRLEGVLFHFPARFREAVLALEPAVLSELQELRLRVGGGLCATARGRVWFPAAGRLSRIPPEDVPPLTPAEMEGIVRSFCQNSVHAFQRELNDGYVTLRGGHRAGLCGSCVLDASGHVVNMKRVTSVNVRIAREHRVSADMLVEVLLRGGRLRGCLVASPPGCGKTTLLRDAARQLSERLWRVAVVDERCELAATHMGAPQNDLGPCCDVYDGYPREQGLLLAVRNMAPDILVCDEIAAAGEIDALVRAMNAGVPALVSAHAGSVRELLQRRELRRLLASGAIETVVLLDSAERPGTLREIHRAGELIGEMGGSGAAHRGVVDRGAVCGG